MQIKGISTFMSEMLEMSNVLQSSTNKSLMLIDELGRGTSTEEGSAIAYSICEHIATKIGGYCLVATHFLEICRLEKIYPKIVKNYHTKGFKNAESKSVVFEYKINEGIFDNSYGIEVAEMLSIPEPIISDAYNKL